jgi:hypothetical protein
VVYVLILEEVVEQERLRYLASASLIAGGAKIALPDLSKTREKLDRALLDPPKVRNTAIDEWRMAMGLPSG